MRSKFYSNRYTLICKEEVDMSRLPQLELFKGESNLVCHEIKKYELDNDMFFSGHFILNDTTYFNRLVNLVEDVLSKEYIPKRNVIVPYVHHHGVDKKCYIDNYYLYCSSWALPFIVGTDRSSNTLYGNILRHRLKIYGQASNRIIE